MKPTRKSGGITELATSETVEVVSLVTDGTRLEGVLTIPSGASGLVVMPQSIPGGHDSARTTYLARLMRTAGVATLVCDLVGAGAAETTSDVLQNPNRLSGRLLGWVDLINPRADLARLSVAFVAAGIAAAAAAIAASRRRGQVQALVCYSGRADLAHDALRVLQVPALFIVAENDATVLRFNRHALGHVRCVRRLEVIAGAHHHFTEPGALLRLAVLARRWVKRHLVVTAGQPVAESASPLLHLLSEATPELHRDL